MATLDLPEVRALCAKISPRVIIPMHFKNDKCSFPKYGVEDFIEGQGNVRMIESSEVELVVDTLPASTQIIVLQHAL